MSKTKTPSFAKKKKRLVQLRDAQRRRRERLRKEKQFFVQIILSEETLEQLTRLIAATGETMQQSIARLVHLALPSQMITEDQPNSELASSVDEPIVEENWEDLSIPEDDQPIRVAQVSLPEPPMEVPEMTPESIEEPSVAVAASKAEKQLDLFG